MHAVRDIRTGRRVKIRHALPCDEEAFIELRRSSGSFLTSWEPIRESGGGGLTSEMELFRRMIEFDDSHVPLLVELQEEPVILGVININQIARGAFQNCALGWWIGRPHARKGYMKEAVALVLDHIFVDLELHRVEANIQADNLASKALARGVGMRKEGFSERFLKIAGRWCDHERWAITIETWPESRDMAH